jgi:hypothetical protein
MKQFAVLQLSGCSGCEVSLLNADEWLDKYKLVYMPLVTSVLPDFKPAASVCQERVRRKVKEMRPGHLGGFLKGGARLRSLHRLCNRLTLPWQATASPHAPTAYFQT